MCSEGARFYCLEVSWLSRGGLPQIVEEYLGAQISSYKYSSTHSLVILFCVHTIVLGIDLGTGNSGKQGINVLGTWRFIILEEKEIEQVNTQMKNKFGK
jgi:hypothetical protein